MQNTYFTIFNQVKMLILGCVQVYIFCDNVSIQFENILVTDKKIIRHTQTDRQRGTTTKAECNLGCAKAGDEDPFLDF